MGAKKYFFGAPYKNSDDTDGGEGGGEENDDDDDGAMGDDVGGGEGGGFDPSWFCRRGWRLGANGQFLLITRSWRGGDWLAFFLVSSVARHLVHRWG